MSEKLADLRAEASRSKCISFAAEKKAVEDQRKVEELEQEETWEKEKAEI